MKIKLLAHFLITFVRKGCGKRLAICHGYTFYCLRQTKVTQHWQCTMWGKCRAKFSTSAEGVIKTARIQHPHLPPKYKIIMTFVRNQLGKTLAILYGYTFYVHKASSTTLRWQCTNTGVCKARFIQSLDGGLRNVSVVHTHKPPIKIYQLSLKL
ncbi:Uncharacterized protein OBRU01_09854 [Operophtera brumata]|uniref:FLYWCH-type domain-containing protein n=1 Tax=Operophtera brumata TaxID=104452 RepID=A0A0L7LEQ5_OPEBR|nr:Uncharacterized protein OBRU01_09854 [Operophtera brumata]